MDWIGGRVVKDTKKPCFYNPLSDPDDAGSKPSPPAPPLNNVRKYQPQVFKYRGWAGYTRLVHASCLPKAERGLYSSTHFVARGLSSQKKKLGVGRFVYLRHTTCCLRMQELRLLFAKAQSNSQVVK